MIDLLQKGSATEAAQVLQRLKEVDDIEDAVNSVAAARLLLPDPSLKTALTPTSQPQQGSSTVETSPRP